MAGGRRKRPRFSQLSHVIYTSVNIFDLEGSDVNKVGSRFGLKENLSPSIEY
ncbi:hypothetical protein FA13DRAFT_1724777 [Coprinellus micaceus]|uniref:Uncharacterized protein n=1 Tax=Coprinellus micaceus TaxID=71717 RepID=A0A4Y7TXV9_COPMI|nr:hypothetical protein FA13DRAFT_1724777 [Coprinellus micaceus]